MGKVRPWLLLLIPRGCRCFAVPPGCGLAKLNRVLEQSCGRAPSPSRPERIGLNSGFFLPAHIAVVDEK